jgi:hypothetical protein
MSLPGTTPEREGRTASAERGGGTTPRTEVRETVTAGIHAVATLPGDATVLAHL